MDSIAELYQALATLPNDPKKLAENVRRCLDALDAELPNSRNLYLAEIAGLGRARLNRAQSLRTEIASDPTSVAATSGAEAIKLRDFFHDLYYATFYAARYAAIKLGFHDSTWHDELPAFLGRIAGELAKAGRSVEQQRVLAIKESLENLQPLRNIADYVASEARLGTLASGQLIFSSETEVVARYSDWSI